MQGDEENMVVGSKADELAADERTCRQVEGLVELRTRLRQESWPKGIRAGKIDSAQIEASCRCDDLNCAVVRRRERGAQRFVPLHDLIECGLQRRLVQLTSE